MALKIWDTFSGTFKRCLAKVTENGSWVAKVVKRKSGSSWYKVGATSFTPNYSERDPIFKYKWGWKCICDEFGEDSGACEVYTRIYNAYKYRDTCSKYLFQDYSDKKWYTLNSTNSGKVNYVEILGLIIGGSSVTGLNIYVDDTHTSRATDAKVHWAVMNDFPELNPKWCFNASDHQYVKCESKDGRLLLPYYGKNDWEIHQRWCNEHFDEIVKLVKKYHNIDFVDLSYEKNNKLYTELEKVKIAKVIHDYIVTHCYYGYNNNAKGGNLEAWTCYSNYYKNPVCSGYAAGFLATCWRWGITCFMVSGLVNYDKNAGTSDGYHKWNRFTCAPITIADSGWNDSSKWMECDLTWDDYTTESDLEGSKHNAVDWVYFCRTTDYVNVNGSNRHVFVYGEGTGRYSKNPPEGTNTSYLKYAYRYNPPNSTTYLYIY